MRRFTISAALVMASASVMAFPAIGTAQAAAATDLVSEAGSLRPGQFVWQPGRATTGEVDIVVSIPLQRAYVYRGGTLVGISTVSTGRAGHETPAGRFSILEKRREHYSNLYDNAPMPFMQRLTWDGIALHAGQIPGRPASHGCIRLPLAFARHLFEATQVGAAVHIIHFSPSAEEALALISPARAYAATSGQETDVPAREQLSAVTSSEFLGRPIRLTY